MAAPTVQVSIVIMLQTPDILNLETYLSDILEELHDEVYVYDASSLRLVYANRTARMRCDWSLHDVPDKKISDSSDEFDTSIFQSHVEPLRQGITDAVTIQAMHEKGLVEITTRLLTTLGGSPVFVSVLRDREPRRQLERARKQAFSEIVHDLRTPLTSIMGAIKLLESGHMGDLPEQAQTLLSLVHRNADTLLTIVGDILDLQKLNTHPSQSEDMEDVNLTALLKEAVAAHIGYCAVHNVTIDMAPMPEQAWVRGLPVRLHQMLANLLSNAIKNSPTGDKVGLNLQDCGQTWQIRISNGGPGIPEHLRSSIFDNYVHSATGTAPKVKGTGLGLAICKKIIKTHGGEIDFSCHTDNRTEFFVNLPKALPITTKP